jgi:hypothetical protein
MNEVFANCCEEDEIFPLKTAEIAEAHQTVSQSNRPYLRSWALNAWERKKVDNWKIISLVLGK